MKASERQALLILITGLESQIQALKMLISAASPTHQNSGTVHNKPQSDAAYTSDDEDAAIERALALEIEDKKQNLMQDIFSKAIEQQENEKADDGAN